MENDEWETAYYSLLSCMVGLISTLDLLHIKDTLDSYPNDLLQEYYDKAIGDHCKMTIYHTEWIM